MPSNPQHRTQASTHSKFSPRTCPGRLCFYFSEMCLNNNKQKKVSWKRRKWFLTPSKRHLSWFLNGGIYPPVYEKEKKTTWSGDHFLFRYTGSWIGKRLVSSTIKWNAFIMGHRKAIPEKKKIWWGKGNEARFCTANRSLNYKSILWLITQWRHNN